jgi:hypothetical protein
MFGEFCFNGWGAISGRAGRSKAAGSRDRLSEIEPAFCLVNGLRKTVLETRGGFFCGTRKFAIGG